MQNIICQEKNLHIKFYFMEWCNDFLHKNDRHQTDFFRNSYKKHCNC